MNAAPHTTVRNGACVCVCDTLGGVFVCCAGVVLTQRDHSSSTSVAEYTVVRLVFCSTCRAFQPVRCIRADVQEEA